MKTRSFVAAIALALIGAMAVMTSASAATYTWRDATSNNNQRYYETSTAGSFSRTGVESFTWENDGTFIHNQVWFGSYTTTGGNSATLTGPRSFLKTSAKWWFVADPTDPGTQKLKVWLLDAKMAGNGRVVDLDASTLAQEEHRSIALTTAELLSGGNGAIRTTSVGQYEGYGVWLGQDQAGRSFVYATKDGYTGGTAINSTDGTALLEFGTEAESIVVTVGDGPTSGRSVEAGTVIAPGISVLVRR